MKEFKINTAYTYQLCNLNFRTMKKKCFQFILEKSKTRLLVNFVLLLNLFQTKMSIIKSTNSFS
jgi:hypothetical protein